MIEQFAKELARECAERALQESEAEIAMNGLRGQSDFLRHFAERVALIAIDETERQQDRPY